MPEDVELPKINPPYSSSMFPDATRHIISLLSYLLGYENDQLVDECILGFFSIFSKEYQPSFMYNYSQFLVDNINEWFMNFTTQGFFRYRLVIIHFILFQQGDSLHIQINMKDEKGVNLSVIHWIELVKVASTKFTFS